jgi:hypothetical protein
MSIRGRNGRDAVWGPSSSSLNLLGTYGDPRNLTLARDRSHWRSIMPTTDGLDLVPHTGSDADQITVGGAVHWRFDYEASAATGRGNSNQHLTRSTSVLQRELHRLHCSRCSAAPKLRCSRKLNAHSPSGEQASYFALRRGSSLATHRELIIPEASVHFSAFSLLFMGIFVKSGGALRSKSFTFDTIVERAPWHVSSESRIVPSSSCIGRHSVSGAVVSDFI